MSAARAHALDAVDANGWTIAADLLGGVLALRVDDVAAPGIESPAVSQLLDAARAALAAQGFTVDALEWAVSFNVVGRTVTRTFTAASPAEGL